MVSTKAGDSIQNAAIQLCDMVAGLSIKAFSLINDKEEGDYIKELLGLGLGNLKANGIRPEPEFPDGPPIKKDGPDVVDQMTKIMFRK